MTGGVRRPGWYDDPVAGLGGAGSDAALLRYWDGARWSPHTAPRPGDDEVPGHTLRLRAPDEHTTVPVPPGDGGSATSAPWIARAAARARARSRRGV